MLCMLYIHVQHVYVHVACACVRPPDGRFASRSQPLLPAAWNDADAPTWQQHTYMLFERLALDKEFVVTCAGTSIFQHILNSVTWVLLPSGKLTTLGQIGGFLAF